MVERFKGKKITVGCGFITTSSIHVQRQELIKGTLSTGVLTDFDDDWIMLDNDKIINKKYIISIKVED